MACRPLSFHLEHGVTGHLVMACLTNKEGTLPGIKTSCSCHSWVFHEISDECCVGTDWMKTHGLSLIWAPQLKTQGGLFPWQSQALKKTMAVLWSIPPLLVPPTCKRCYQAWMFCPHFIRKTHGVFMGFPHDLLQVFP